MKEGVVARRYAKALFDLADKHDLVEQINKDWQIFIDTIQTNQQLSDALNSKVISIDNRKALLKDVFGIDLHTLILNCLYLLIDKDRIEISESISYSYQQLIWQKNNIVPIQLTTAKLLPSEQEEQLEQAISSSLNKTALLDIAINPALIGGAVMKIGDTIYDGSIKSQLKVLKQHLSSN